MSDPVQNLVERHWELANTRRWDEFAALLHPRLRYEVPQTREYLDSGAGYLELFRTWPGHWSATIRHLVCEAPKAICVFDFAADGSVVTGISVIEIEAGLIARVTDYWPDPYEPPPRATPMLRRRPA